MKEFIEKLIGRLEECEERYDDVSFAQLSEFGITLDYKYAEGKRDGVAESISIVNELAEEYINTSTDTSSGWIPCSERLPKKSGKYLITQERYSLEDRLCKRPIAIEVDYVVFNATDNLWARASFFKVIAWMPLPAPYKEGVTENE